LEPINFVGAPSLDLSVENRLRRMDKNLVLTWSPYALNPDSGKPIEHSGRLDPDPDAPVFRRGQPIHDPGWYLWRKDTHSSHHFFVCGYKEFGHPELDRLESDLAKLYSPEKILKLVRDRADERRAKGRAAYKAHKRDVRRANTKRIGDLVFEGKDGYRAARVTSYGGQTDRRSSGERDRIWMDNKEAGWETPEPGDL
jgi:hypothetical protein